ncbi:MAG: XRE family transcriptional regulator [Paracoccaceae bacterium]|nr:XRE family transcriptional regulator [Paracoccaceae bacterium]
MSQPPATLGADLRALRKSRGLTLTDLAEKLDVSVGWLSQVERDISTPDTLSLRRLADQLDVPLSILAGGGSGNERGLIVRANNRRSIGMRVEGLSESLLSPDLTDDFEMVHSRFSPGAKLTEPVRRPTQELAYMVEGKLDIWLDDQKFTVSAGDSFRVRNQNLRWANPYARAAVAVWVIAPPVY